METNPVLRKVRALLAKAEATTFDAEAEAFTAKAQELIARHRIDRALLAEAGTRDQPCDRRIDVDNPYASAKVLLLAKVASANDCHVVWCKSPSFARMFGFADDLDAVEELYTSLLVQATAAMQRAGSKQDAVGRSRTKSFRRAFLVAFAVRIGQRLQNTVDTCVAEATATSGGALAPILSARSASTEAAARAAFPDVRPMRRTTVRDAEGWHAGSVFADQADLSVLRKVNGAA